VRQLQAPSERNDGTQSSIEARPCIPGAAGEVSKRADYVIFPVSRKFANRSLQQTGHANNGIARHDGFSRVSRLLSCALRNYGAVALTQPGSPPNFFALLHYITLLSAEVAL
jgi:hypothetical protein